MTVGQSSSGINIQMNPGTSVSGTVYGGSGTSTPVADVCVEVYEASDQYDVVGFAETASNGTYTVDQLTPGTGYLVEFNPSCAETGSQYLAQWYDDGASAASATTVTPTASPSTGINANLVVGGSISGQVTDAGGDPITTRDICVAASSTTGDYYGSARTDASGDYTIIGLASGSYDVEASDCSGSTRDDLPTYYGAPTAVSVTVGQASSGINIQMNPGTSISGTVYGGSGTSTPVDNVCVYVYEASDHDEIGFAETASNGTYTVAHLTPGTGYLVWFKPSCYGETSSQYVAQWYDGAATEAAATTVTPTVASPSIAINANLVVGASISGTVYGGSGTSTPVANVCVYVYDASNESDEVGFAETASNGTYTVDQLTPGTGYLVEFNPRCYTTSSYAIQWYDDAASAAGATAVVPTSTNPSSGIDANLTTGASISGQVTDATGDPITTQDICVEAITSDGVYIGSATTGATGDYTIVGLSAGSYYVYFSDCADSSRNDVAVYYGNSIDRSSSELVTLSVGGAQTGVDAQLPAATSISGFVYGGSGTSTPLDGACVDIYGSADYTGSTSSTGAYTIKHIAPGKSYTVYFSQCSSGAQYISTYYGGDYDPSTAESLSPTVADPATGIDANLPIGGSISGTVKDSQGNPISSGVCEEASLTSGSGDYYQEGGSLSSSGGYTIDGLPTGTHYIDFYDCGGSRNDLPDNVSDISVTQPNATTGIDATMRPATSISGTVYGGSGADTPLANVCVYADDSKGDFEEESETGQNGEYAIDYLAPGSSYVVEFDPTCVGSNPQYETQYYDGVSTLSQAALLTPTLASPSTGINADLPSGAPVTTITGGPAANAETNESTASFAFTANVTGASFQCSLDGGALASCSSPYTTPTLSNGQHSFTVEATANGYRGTSQTVSWTVNTSSLESTSQGQVTSGGTFSSDPGGSTSTSNPVIVTVTPPSSSQVTLTTEPTTTSSPNGYTIFGEQVDISAAGPSGSGTVTGTASDPITLNFTLDASQIPAGTSTDSITVTRNGVPAQNCQTQNGTANPNPCIERRTTDSNGDLTIEVLTTECSAWNFAAAQPPPAPTVTGVSPSSGPAAGATSVTITGTNLTGATAVKFGTTASGSFTFNSATQITATSPAGSGKVDVTVTTPGGTSATSSAAQYTYVPAPAVTGVSPSSGPAAGGTSVTITGTNLTGATASASARQPPVRSRLTARPRSPPPARLGPGRST